MDESVDYLDPVTRRRIQEARLEREQERLKARRKEQIKHEWLTRLAPLMQAVTDLTGGAALVVEDQMPLRRRLAASFSFKENEPLPDWERVPAATVRTVSFSNHRALRWTLQQLAAHVDAKSSDRVTIIWRDADSPALSMS